MQEFIDRFQEVFNLARMAEWAAGMIPNVMLAVLVFGVFYLIYRTLSAAISHIAGRIGLERTAAGFLLIGIKYVILIFGALTALQQVGINVASIIAGLGIAGLSLGFAAKDALANIIAGIFIFWDKPFVIGDLIEASDEYGEVSEITLRTTRIITVDGRMVSIPNSMIVNNKIASYTMHPHLRLDIDVTIGVNEDIGKARNVIVAVVKGDSRFLELPQPVAIVTTLGDYFVGLQLRVWLGDERSHIAVRAELREKIKLALDEAGIVMPYETIEVIQKSDAPSRPVSAYS